MPEYKARQGDCISSIAYRNGFFWETVWNHPNNRALKELRANPNVLQMGDLVFLPEKELRQADGQTEQRHRFLLKGVPAKLCIRLMETAERPADEPSETIETGRGGKDLTISRQWPEPQPIEEEPCVNVPFILEIDGRVAMEDETDADGYLEVHIPPDAQEGRLIVEAGTPRERIIPLNLGHLDPIDTVTGVKQRLFNLGFACGPIDMSQTPAFAEALRQFQEVYTLETTGEPDPATQEKLREAHGS